MAKIISFSPLVKTKGKSAHLNKSGKVVDINAISFFEQALILDEQNQPDKAKEKYLSAIEHNEDIDDSFCNLGIIEKTLGNDLKSFDCFSKALVINPRNAEAHYNLAGWYFDNDEDNLGKIHLEIAIQIDPDLADAYFNLGLFHGFKKQFELAIKYLMEYHRRVHSEQERQIAMELIDSARKNVNDPVKN